MPAPPATPTAPTPPTLGERLRRRRWAELRVFQADLAAAAGLSPAQLCEIERGTAGTTAGTLRRIADALGLDFAELAAQAEREGRLARRRGRRPGGRRPSDPLAAGPATRLPQQPVAATKPWLSTREAAALLGCTPGVVAYLIRRGKLRPAVLEPKTKHGQRRWLVAAAAVERYDPPNRGRAWARRPQSAPAGYLSVEEFARAVGVAKATLYRRVAQWGLTTVTTGNRRWFPADQVAAFRRRQRDEDTS